MPDYTEREGGVITEADIERARTAKGGWTAAQFRAWGIPWPPTRGWKQRLINQTKGTTMTDEQIKHMTNRFLSWKLPENFNPDNGISAHRPNYGEGVAWEPTGTNLLDFAQAQAMVRHLVDGLPSSDGLPDDVVRLVIAAREIAYSDLDGGGEESKAARNELDVAVSSRIVELKQGVDPTPAAIAAASLKARLHTEGTQP